MKHSNGYLNMVDLELEQEHWDKEFKELLLVKMIQIDPRFIILEINTENKIRIIVAFN